MARKRRSEPGTIELLLRLPKQILALAKIEFANAKQEMKGGLIKLIIAVVCAIIALSFLFWAIAAFVASAILGLANVLAPWLSALLIAAALVLLTAAVGFAGFLLIKRANPVPGDTLDRVGDDLHVASTVRYNSEPDIRVREAERLRKEK